MDKSQINESFSRMYLRAEGDKEMQQFIVNEATKCNAIITFGDTSGKVWTIIKGEITETEY